MQRHVCALGRPLECGLDELPRKLLSMLEAAAHAHIDVRLEDGEVDRGK